MNKKLIVNELDRLFNKPVCELKYTHDYELLLSVMLSARTTDKKVNEVTKELYMKYNSLEKLNSLTVNEISCYIKQIGLYKTKSYNFKNIVSALNKIGYVPNDRNYLESLNGVGRKTASVVLSLLYNEPSFAVDTHVHRLAFRFGITKSTDDVIKTEIKLKEFFDIKEWNRVNSQMVLFGRYICTSKNPKCNECNLKRECNYYKKHNL